MPRSRTDTPTTPQVSRLSAAARFLASLGVVISAACSSATTPQPPPAFPRGGLIAHALGGIEGLTYTNSREAFVLNYRLGRRWFEVDLELSRDGQLFAFHSKLERFLGLDRPFGEHDRGQLANVKYAKRYPLATFDEVLDLLAGHEGSILVTDTKSWSPEMASAVSAAIARRSPGLAERVVPQLYHPADLPRVRDAAAAHGLAFPRYIFTLYQSTLSDEEIAAFVQQNRIPIVVVSTQRFSPWSAAAFHAAGAVVLVHTVNSHPEIERFAASGADGFYTDFYRPYESLFETSAERASAHLDQSWLSYSLGEGKRFSLDPCLKRKGSSWVGRGCGSRWVLAGPRAPAPAGATVEVTVQLRAFSGDHRAMLRLSSGGTKQLHYESAWELIRPGSQLTARGSARLAASVADLQVFLYVRRMPSPAASSQRVSQVPDAARAADATPPALETVSRPEPEEEPAFEILAVDLRIVPPAAPVMATPN